MTTGKASSLWVNQTLRTRVVKTNNTCRGDTERLTKEPVVSILLICFCYTCNCEEIEVMNFSPNTSLPLAFHHITGKMKVIWHTLNLVGFWETCMHLLICTLWTSKLLHLLEKVWILFSFLKKTKVDLLCKAFWRLAV